MTDQHRTESATDAELMTLVREGELGLLEPLFDRHHLRIFNYCLRLVGNRTVSEDLTQEVFLRLLKYRSSFRPGSELLPWLYRLARNVCIDHLRSSRREDPVEDAPQLIDRQPRADDSLGRQETLDQLRRTLARLPDDQREILVLARFEALDYRQIAELLGCSVGAVKLRVFRAMQRLRSLYPSLQKEGT